MHHQRQEDNLIAPSLLAAEATTAVVATMPTISVAASTSHVDHGGNAYDRIVSYRIE
jgi:creatinine amidohydrolase/Fe(II)-dependent formamide hydrolase-like protein